MSGSGGFAVSRTHGGDRFYNPPPIRRQQLLQKQKQQRLQRQLSRPVNSDAAEAENRTDSDDSTTTLSKQTPSVCSSSSPPRPQTNLSNLDRLMESVTPFVLARHFPEENVKGWRTRESDTQPYYCLGDLWESFREWSVYGAGVPLLLNGKDSIIQYYVPFLSGIQLYADPRSRLRSPGEEIESAGSCREIINGCSSDCESERPKYVADESSSSHKVMNLNSDQMNRLSLIDKSITSSSSDESEMSSSPETLLFEYLEREQPYNRRPLTDKVSVLASQFPDLRTYRSCDLLPSSWISVAWYPIYRIPMGPTLRDLDASFLTFHDLSTRTRRNVRWQFHGRKKVHSGIDVSAKISLPAFGLASYKLKGSILTPTGPYECEQENSLLQAADNWLHSLQIILPDYQFFLSHCTQRR